MTKSNEADKPHKRCFVVYAHAPQEMDAKEANTIFNAFVSDENIGMLFFHDHFTNPPGGLAILYVNSATEHKILVKADKLSGWNVQIHPLVFSDSPQGLLYQFDWTMSVYRKTRLGKLYESYLESEYKKDIDQNWGGLP